MKCRTWTWVEGRLIAFIFIFIFYFFMFFISRISGPVANDPQWIISNLKVFKTYSRWSWHITFLHGQRSEGIISRVACGSCIISIIVQNDRIKEYIFGALATSWLAKIAVP